MSITSDTIRHKNSFVNYRRIYPAFVKTMASACHYIVHFGRILAAGNWKSAAKVLTMEDNFAIQLFEGKKVRIVWDEEKVKYWFSVVDIVQVLTDSADGRTYWKVLKTRLKKEGNESVTNCYQLKLPNARIAI